MNGFSEGCRLKPIHACAIWGEGKKTVRQVVMYPGEDGYWVTECPSLPGCVSQGKSRAEAIANIKEAIHGYIAALEEDNLPIPEARFATLLIAV